MSSSSDGPGGGHEFFIGGELKPLDAPANPTAGTFPWTDVPSPTAQPAPGPAQPAFSAADPAHGPMLYEKLQALTAEYLQQYQGFERTLYSAELNVTPAEQSYMMMTMDYRVMQSKGLARVNFVRFVLGEMNVWKSQLGQIAQTVDQRGSGDPDAANIKALLTGASGKVQEAIAAWTDGLQKCEAALQGITTSIDGVRTMRQDIARGIVDSTKAMNSSVSEINAQFSYILNS